MSGLRTTYIARTTPSSISKAAVCTDAFGGVDDDAGETVDGRKAHPEVVAPPRAWTFARDLDPEPRGSIGAVDDFQRRRYFTAAIGHDPHVAGEQLRQRLEIARAGGDDERGQELGVLRIEVIPTRRSGGAAWPRRTHVRASARGTLFVMLFLEVGFGYSQAVLAASADWRRPLRLVDSTEGPAGRAGARPRLPVSASFGAGGT